MTYSFDVFDTCLVRACPPLVVFDILASRLMPNQDESLWFEFAQERINGEHRAICKYTSKEKEEVSLEEIYSCCDYSAFPSLPSNSSIMKMELEVESEVLSPVNNVRDKITRLRKEGNQIVFISDMYLPQEFIKEILSRNRIFCDDDELFVSSHYGKRKSTSNLFRLVHDKLGLDYKHWVHYGDNQTSDFDAPKRLGIKAVITRNKQDYYEKRLQAQDMTSRRLTAHVMAYISRAVRLREKNDIQWSFACEMIAPAFVPFVYGLLCDAKRRGITDIFFMARDSYIFYEIAKEWQNIFQDIKIHYLLVSRDSLYLPGLPDISIRSVAKLFQKYDWSGIENILSRLHMIEWMEKAKAIVPQNATNTESILSALLGDKEFNTALQHKYEEQRMLAVNYFKEENLGSGHAAVVDLRGTRRCQMAINDILLSAGLKEVFGYYFEVLPNPKTGGSYKALNFSYRYDRVWPQFGLGPYGLFEQYYCVTPFNRTYGYKLTSNGEVAPVYEKDYQSNKYKNRTSKINIQACKAYAALYAQLLGQTNHWQNSEKACTVLTEFFKYPKAIFLKPLEECVMSDSQVQHNALLEKRNILSILKSWRHAQWSYGNLIYNSHCPEFWRLALKLFFGRKT